MAVALPISIPFSEVGFIERSADCYGTEDRHELNLTHDGVEHKNPTERPGKFAQVTRVFRETTLCISCQPREAHTRGADMKKMESHVSQ
jgi:hypothetical protein